MGTIMQETSATPSRKGGVVSTKDINANTTTTCDSADLSSPCRSSRLMNRVPPSETPEQGLTGVIVCPSSGTLVRSDSSDGSNEMSYESKAKLREGGLFCRAFASLKALVMHQDRN